MNATKLASMINKRTENRPVRLGLVLGSGLSGFSDAIKDAVSIPYSDLPGFPLGNVSGHKKYLIIGNIEGVEVAVLGGRFHYYERGEADAMRLPLQVLQELGAETVLLTNSAGSIREDIPPGSQMIITDHINLSGANPLIGEEGDGRFTDMVDAYDPELSELVRIGAQKQGIQIESGVYAWFSGPSFETPAEVNMAKILGADAVGMSTVPEVILARFLGLKCVGISNVTNMAAGLSASAITHKQTKEVAQSSAKKFESILRGFLSEYSKTG